jgi:hypothetical protein
MDPERLEEEILSDMGDIKKYEKISNINGVYIGYKRKEKSISNITIAASITAKARIKLYKGMLKVMEDGGRILYTDTDSIIAAYNINVYKQKLDKDIGEIRFDSKNTNTIIEDAVFALPKTYALKYKDCEITKIKGFNVVPNFDKFKQAFYNKSNITTKNTE